MSKTCTLATAASILTLLFYGSVLWGVTVQQTTLYAFSGKGGDSTPVSALVADAAGNLYGVTPLEVYEVSPPASPGGAWAETVLYTFTGATDGGQAAGALVFDATGNLYGTTQRGGLGTNCNGGCGVVFELSPPSAPGGSWTETILYNFQGSSSDGATPFAGVAFDAAGSLYGTTTLGGRGKCLLQSVNQGCGTVFRLAPPAGPGAPWIETVLHQFSGGSDGAIPYAGVTFDAKGNFYGATEFGGGGCVNGFYYGGCGTIFRFSPSDGNWIGKIVFRFVNSAASNPFSSLTIHNGSIYGTNESSVYRLSSVNGVPTLSDLYNVTDGCAFAYSAVIFDNVGNIYGTASDQGCSPYVDEGFTYQLQPPQLPGGAWMENILSYDGDPFGGVILLDGLLYGTDQLGGNLTDACDGFLGCGIVYSLSVTK